MGTSNKNDLRERKAKAEERATDAIERHEREVRLMQETNNLLMKALHFRNACKAHEDLDYSGYRVSVIFHVDLSCVKMKKFFIR